VSYDLTIATHLKPAKEQIEAWAASKEFVVIAEATDSLTVEKASGKGERFVCQVDGPHAAEPDDFDDELAAACLAPRWMMQISVPYSVPKVNIRHARSLARVLAGQNQGAAFDPQEDGLIWPRGSPKRVPARPKEERTKVITLEWFFSPTAWQRAPERWLHAVQRLCPEAVPTRYGPWEPLQHRFDPNNPDEFVRFMLDNELGDAFWFSSRPSFGGSYFAPHADKYARPEDGPFRIGSLQTSFDGRVLEADRRWLETVVSLFVTVAAETRAFFAAAQVGRGWIVTSNNRLYADASTEPGGHFLRGRLWQGLPPQPTWLTWYGDPYRPLVVESVRSDSLDGVLMVTLPTAGVLRRLLGRSKPRTSSEPSVIEREEGIFVRLSDDPRPRDELSALPLPSELTYSERRPIVRPDGAWESNPAQREDRAALIPPLAP
jgi:hypothetical protein